jgi:hypothetical protein
MVIEEANMIVWNKYPPTLRPKHIEEIMGRSPRKTYEFLSKPPFHVARDGNQIFISKAVFRNWLEGTNLDVIQSNESSGK